jgi:effector-binding domain-containing protein
MSYHCQAIDRSVQPVLSVRTNVSIESLPDAMGKAYGDIMRYLGELGEYPAGAPFAAYYNMDMQNLDVEIGFPVSRELPGKSQIQAGEIPGGSAATCIYTGPYKDCAPAYKALSAWIKENGYEASGVAYEFYLNDPGQVPPEELQMQILFPLE